MLDKEFMNFVVHEDHNKEINKESVVKVLGLFLSKHDKKIADEIKYRYKLSDDWELTAVSPLKGEDGIKFLAEDLLPELLNKISPMGCFFDRTCMVDMKEVRRYWGYWKEPVELEDELK